MDLSTLFEDFRVKRGTHIVMKSVGVEAGKQYKGWAILPKKDSDGNPAHEIFPKTQLASMEANGWVLVKPVVEPTDAKTTKKAKADVEG